MAFVSFDDLKKGKPASDEPLPGNIFSDIPKGMAYGVETQIVSPLLTEGQNAAALMGNQKLAEFFRGAAQAVRDAAETGWESPAENPVATAQFKEHPIRKSFWNAATSAPISAAAAIGTIATGNPLVGAAIFAPPIHGQMLEKAFSKGLPLGKANEYALAQSIPQVALESLPLPTLLKGGSLWKRMLSVGWQEAAEEGLQQPVQNYFDKYVYNLDPRTDSKFNDIMDGTVESMAAGALSGGFMGSLGHATVEDYNHDRVKGREKLLAKGATPEQLTEYDKRLPEIKTKEEIEAGVKRTFTSNDTEIVAYLDHMSRETEGEPNGIRTDPVQVVPFKDRPKTIKYINNLLSEMDLKDNKGKTIKFNTLAPQIAIPLEYITWLENKTNKTPEVIASDLKKLISEKILGPKAIIATGTSKAGFEFQSMIYSGALKMHDTINNVVGFLRANGIGVNDLNYSFIRANGQVEGDMVARLKETVEKAYRASAIPEVVKPTTSVESKSYAGGGKTIIDYFTPQKKITRNPDGTPINPNVPYVEPVQEEEIIEEPIEEPIQEVVQEPAIPIAEPQSEPIVPPEAIQEPISPIVEPPKEVSQAEKSILDQKKEVLGVPTTQDTEDIPMQVGPEEHQVLSDLLALEYEEENYYKNKDTIDKEFEQKEKEIFAKIKEGHTETQTWVRQSSAVVGEGPTGNMAYLPLDLNSPNVFRAGQLGVLTKLGKALADKTKTFYLYFDKVPTKERLKEISNWNRSKFKTGAGWKPGIWIKHDNLVLVFPDKITAAETKRINEALSKKIPPKYEKEIKELGQDKSAALRMAWKIKEQGKVAKDFYLNQKEEMLRKLSPYLRKQVEKLSAERLSEFMASLNTGVTFKEIEDYATEDVKGEPTVHMVGENEDVELKPGEIGLKFFTPVTVIDIYGVAHEINGPFRINHILNEDLNAKEKEALGSDSGVQFIDGDEFVLSPKEFLGLHQKILSGEIDAEHGINEAFGGLTPEARERFKDLKPNTDPVNTVEVTDVMPDKIKELQPYMNPGVALTRVYPLKLFFRALDFLPFGKSINDHLDNFWGQDKMNKLRKPKDFTDITDEIVSNLYGDKTYRRNAQSLAEDQMRPYFEVIIGQSRKDFAQANPDLKGAELKKAHQEYAKNILSLMAFASPEVFCNGEDSTKYQFTNAALPGDHLPSNNSKTPDGEARAYVKAMMNVINVFKIPILDVARDLTVSQRQIFDMATKNGSTLEAAMEDALFSGRMEKSFWNLLTHKNVCSDNTYQNLIVMAKGEIETPNMNHMIEANVFNNADMFKNIMRGYMNRLWLKKEQQATGTGYHNTIGSTDQPSARYNTYYEFAWQAEAEGLEPVLDWNLSMMDYISDSLMTVHQVKTLKVLKTFNAIIPLDVIEKWTAPLDGYTKDEVKKALMHMKLVEYESSDNIKKIVKLTGARANQILQDLGYIQDKSAPGLAEWLGGSFHDPYVYKTLHDLTKVMFERRNPDSAIGKVITSTNMIKRWLTVNPYDSTFLWMSGVMVNSNPIEIVTKILPDYVRTMAMNLPFVGKAGRAISKGEYWNVLDKATYPLLPKFMKYGFPGSHLTHMTAVTWDDYELGKYPFPELNTPGENFMENISQVGGTNAAIFQQFVFKWVYHILEKRYNMLLTEIDPVTGRNFNEEDAARLATKFVTETSFMLPPEKFGKEGKWLSLALFTRQLTTGFINQITGALHPLLKGTGIYKYHEGSASSVLNAFFHGETKQSDMDYLAKLYAMHIGKMVTLKVLALSLLQYMLSFGDDEEEDEHGQTAKGDPWAKKRFMSFNEPGKRWVLRTPWKDINQRRIYMDFQILREANQLCDIAGWYVDKSWGQGPGKWFMNRMNTFPRWMLEIMTNADFQGQPISTFQANNPDEFFRYQLPEMKEFFAKEMLPFGAKEEVGTGNANVDSALRGINWLGGTTRKGAGVEAGYTAEEYDKMKRLVAFFAYKQKMQTKDINMLTPEQLKDLPASKYLTNRMIRNAIKKKNSPVRMFMGANRSRIRKESEE